MVEVTAEEPAITLAVLVPLVICIWLLVVTEKFPSVESATTKAGIVDVTALEPATTLAKLAPLEMTTVPEVRDVTVGLDDRITVKLDDGVTVAVTADESATVLLVNVT